jgi:hypothetical protein
LSGITVILLFENATDPLLLTLYWRANVCEPAVNVIYATVLDCTPPVLELVPALRDTAFKSLGVPLSTETLSHPWSPDAGRMNPVMMTMTRVPVVKVTEGFVPEVQLVVP